MIRDARMQTLVAKEKEPITPFISKVQDMHSACRPEQPAPLSPPSSTTSRASLGLFTCRARQGRASLTHIEADVSLGRCPYHIRHAQLRLGTWSTAWLMHRELWVGAGACAVSAARRVVASGASSRAPRVSGPSRHAPKVTYCLRHAAAQWEEAVNHLQLHPPRSVLVPPTSRLVELAGSYPLLFGVSTRCAKHLVCAMKHHDR